jgi:hypothetical protein
MVEPRLPFVALDGDHAPPSVLPIDETTRCSLKISKNLLEMLDDNDVLM